MTRGAWLRGRRGQSLAVGIALPFAAVLWFGAVAPARVFVDDLHLTGGAAPGSVLQVSMPPDGMRLVPAAPGR